MKHEMRGREKFNSALDVLKGTVEVDCWWYYLLLISFLLDLVISAITFIGS